MSPIVLDASVAVKWFLTDESRRDDALVILDEIATDTSRFIVPDLFFIECAAVIARRTGEDGQFTRNSMTALHDLGIATVPCLGTLLHHAIDLATRHRHSVYDCVYLALAKETSGKWLTADIRAARKLKQAAVRLL